MARDISPERFRLVAARTSGATGFVVLSMPAAEPMPSSEDVLIVRDPGGFQVVARYLGPLPEGIDVGQPHVLVDVFILDDTGTPLIDLIGESADSPGQPEMHDWGGVGLPDGLETRVRERRLGGRADDTSIAFRSEGYREYRNSDRLRLTPGDVVWHGGRRSMIIQVNRRHGSMEVEAVAGEPETVPLDDLDNLEHAR